MVSLFGVIKMNMYKTLFFITILVLGLAGCSTTLNLHSDKVQTRSSISVLSPVGIYPERPSFTSILIKSIDDVSVGEFTREITLDPGVHTIKYQASKNGRVCNEGSVGLAYCFEQAVGEMDILLEAGHTYVPNVIFTQKSADVFLVDKGINFPQRCLPRNMEIAGKKNPNKCEMTSKKD